VEVVTLKGLLIFAVLGGWAAVANSANAAGDGAEAAAARAGDAVFADHSDAALTALAAEWDTLDVHQRRALLTEMRRRMAQQGDGSGDVIHIRTERRYGRIIQQADGSVIRIETQVVQVRPVTEGALVRQTGGFGVGFERRVREGGLPGSTGAQIEQIDTSTVTGQLPTNDDAGRRTPTAAAQPTP